MEIQWKYILNDGHRLPMICFGTYGILEGIDYNFYLLNKIS